MFDWYDLVPEEVAFEQIAWERRALIRRMSEVGFSHAEIGRRFGITGWRVTQIVRGRPTDRRYRLSPVERYCSHGGQVAAMLMLPPVERVSQPKYEESGFYLTGHEGRRIAGPFATEAAAWDFAEGRRWSG